MIILFVSFFIVYKSSIMHFWSTVIIIIPEELYLWHLHLCTISFHNDSGLGHVTRFGPLDMDPRRCLIDAYILWLALLEHAGEIMWRRAKMPRTNVSLNQQTSEWYYCRPSKPTKSLSWVTTGEIIREPSAKPSPKQSTKLIHEFCSDPLLYSNL